MPAAKSSKSTTKKSKGAGNFQAEVVETPLKSDILCGKDKSCVAHEGSVRFRKIIDQYRERYCSDSTSKQQRMAITKEIVQRLSKSARFLKYDNKEKVWKTINALAARDKVSHALRFANLKENRKTGKVKTVRRRVSSASSSTSSSNSSNSNHATNNNKSTTTTTTSPEDAKLWNSLVKKQVKLLESIKRGEKGSIPAIVEFPEIITVTPEKKTTTTKSTTQAPPSSSEIITDCDPLSINHHIDSSFVVDPTFQDYCLNLYTSEEEEEEEASAPTTGGPNTVPDDSMTVVTDSYQYCEQSAESSSSSSHDQAPSSKNSISDSSSCHDDEENCLYEEHDSVQDEGISNNLDDRGDEIASMITEPLMEWDLEHDGIFEV